MKAVIIIPTYNERENITSLVNKVLELKANTKLKINIGIIIVDDNSPDGTGKIADELHKKHPQVEVIHRKKKLGLGSAYKSGFKLALKKKFDLIVTMDADFSHNPREIPNLLTKADKFDVVIGSRYVVGGNIVGFSIWRKLLSFLAQVLCRIVLGLKILDSTSGFRVYKREALKKINVFSIKSQGYSFLIEAIFRCSQKKIATCEVPISFINRARGKSKVSQAEILKALSTVIRLCFA